MTREEYRLNPCRASALPYWKSSRVTVPPHMRVVRDDQLAPGLLDAYHDEPYFKLCHNLARIEPPPLPLGVHLVNAEIGAYVRHIRTRYTLERVSEEELREYQHRPTYKERLWLALAEDASGRMVASGIAELDTEIGEGILEWIQVSPDYRRQGLGRYVVRELLYRLKADADFVTVSGRILNGTRPELLYEACGFTQKTVWHILTKKYETQTP